MHCAEKIVSARLRTGSVLAEKVGQGEVGGVTHRVTCTWWLLWLSVEMPWLALAGWSNSCLVCTNRLRKHCSHLVMSSFLAVKAFSALNGCLLGENAD